MTLARADHLLFVAILNAEDARPAHHLSGNKVEWDRLLRGGYIRISRRPGIEGAVFITEKGRRLRAFKYRHLGKVAPAAVGASA